MTFADNSASLATGAAGPDATDARLDALTEGLPKVASRRTYLRSGLPALYQESEFAMRFVGALETVLDPTVAVLDSLPAYFDPKLAPEDVLEMLAGWLGCELDETWSADRRRELVQAAAELSRLRGTKAGLEQTLRLAFPDVPIRVEDAGGVHYATEPGQLPPAGPPSFIVYCDVSLEVEQQAAIARVIEELKPVNAEYRLKARREAKAPDES